MAKLLKFREYRAEIAARCASARGFVRGTVMPLRVRLIALVGLVLLASLACGSMLVGWHAAKSVQTELRAALDVGTKTIRNGFSDLAYADDQTPILRHLIATFNGNRHVRAMLLSDSEHVIAQSELLPPQPVPTWFYRLIAGTRGTVRLRIPRAREGVAAIELQADPTNEIGEVWAESRDAVLVLAGFALLSAGLSYLAVQRALRPLEGLSTAFERIGKGDYHGSVPECGPPELARLANGFNLMTRRLARVAAQNRRLHERLLTLQAEERADLARDLHDEIGPLLFAVSMTTATIEHLAGSRRDTAIVAHVRSIHDAVARAQRSVRAILGRLRPLQTIGLDAAINRLVAFWHSRRPDIDITVRVGLDEDRIDQEMKETIYRVIQEGLSNAIRHGEPERVAISIVFDRAHNIRVEVVDDGIGMPADGQPERGPARFGLIGMRERVMALAGSLSIEHGGQGKGLALVACLPCPDPLQPDEQEEERP
jgi:two-component system sensor histidine kinase UhpB